jgi:hypothetical protein
MDERSAAGKKEGQKNPYDNTVNSMVGAAMMISMKSRRDKLIVGIDTSWIPGYKRGEEEYNFESRIVQNLKALNKNGAGNIDFVVRASGRELRDALAASGESPGSMIILGGEGDLALGIYDAFKTVNRRKGAFITAIDPRLLDEAYKNKGTDEVVNAKILELLAISLGIAAGGDLSSNLSIVKSYDPESRILLLLPVAEAVDYNAIVEDTQNAMKALSSV